MDSILWAIVLCGLASLLYGYATGTAILKADPGNKRMQEIAGYVQEGAAAYLNRQYSTIGIVGAIMFVVIGVLLGWLVASSSRGLERGFSRQERDRQGRGAGVTSRDPRQGLSSCRTFPARIDRVRHAPGRFLHGDHGAGG